MSTQGPLSGATSGNAGGWINPDNAKTTNAIYATRALTALTPSGDLSMSNYSFTTSGTINGIQVDIVRHASASASITFNNTNGGAGVSLSKTANTRTGTAKLDSTAWGTGDATTTFGSGADLWGTTWTTAEVNATGFGCVMECENDNPSLSRTASIDSILITVTYTPAATGAAAAFFAFFRKILGQHWWDQIVRGFPSLFPAPVTQSRIAYVKA